MEVTTAILPLAGDASLSASAGGAHRFRSWTVYGPTGNCVSVHLDHVEGTEPLGLGHPFWGTHKKMTEIDEKELHEFMRLKHHSHGLKNQHFG